MTSLSRRMSITKQSAAKTIAGLEERGFVWREPDPADRRRIRLHVTEHGLAMLREGEAIFDELREQWERQVGADSIKGLEDTLRRLLGNTTGRLDTPGWLMQDLESDG